jgi:hypothetical protein
MVFSVPFPLEAALALVLLFFAFFGLTASLGLAFASDLAAVESVEDAWASSAEDEDRTESEGDAAAVESADWAANEF